MTDTKENTVQPKMPSVSWVWFQSGAFHSFYIFVFVLIGLHIPLPQYINKYHPVIILTIAVIFSFDKLHVTKMSQNLKKLIPKEKAKLSRFEKQSFGQTGVRELGEESTGFILSDQLPGCVFCCQACVWGCFHLLRKKKVYPNNGA